jgi:pimeloyl-ACP methyl ester carboxylesterase
MSSPSLSDEKILSLRDGRQLAYSENGNPSSSTLILFFHGLFGVGRADRLSPVFLELNVHFVAPTIPGFGNSSPRPERLSYAANLASDIGQLVDHLHPDAPNLRIYVAGGSYGTAPAQMIYGAPFEVFPQGRKLAGCILFAPFSPFKWHKGYHKSMTWNNYISVGPPSQYVPFRLIPRMLSWVIARKMTSVDKAGQLLRELLFDKMGSEEKTAFESWRQKEGLEKGEFERKMAENAVKSVSKTWIGFIECSDVLHEDWGFRPDQLGTMHTDRPILILPSTEDELGSGMANWLAENYKNSELKWIKGGHISSMYEMDSIWESFIRRTQ